MAVEDCEIIESCIRKNWGLKLSWMLWICTCTCACTCSKCIRTCCTCSLYNKSTVCKLTKFVNVCNFLIRDMMIMTYECVFFVFLSRDQLISSTCVKECIGVSSHYNINSIHFIGYFFVHVNP